MTYSTAPRRNQGFILREEAALKHYLSGMIVYDNASMPNGRRVDVFFRDPEIEVKSRNFPYIAIERIGITRDTTREHRGRVRLDNDPIYQPDGLDRSSPDAIMTDWPIPMLLSYQVSTNARLAQHDVQITVLMTTEKFTRFSGILPIDIPEAPDDHSIRRVDLVSGPVTADEPDPGSPHKRIFRKLYTVEIPSELFLSEFESAAAARQFLIHIGVRHGTVTEYPGGVLT